MAGASRIGYHRAVIARFPSPGRRLRPGTLCRHPATAALCRLLALWAALGPVAHAQSVWTKKTSDTPEFLLGVCHGNATYVAVGENGAIVASPDATSWSPASPGTNATLRAVIHADGQFVAAGENGAILTSPDGASWTARSSGVTDFLSGLAHGAGRYVAVGANGTILTSPDAIGWTPAGSGTTAFLQGVSHAAGLFVATGAGGTILTSPDGLAWSAPPSPTSSFLVGSGHFGGRHFVVGQNGFIASSPDGTAWHLETSGTLETLRSFTTDGTTAVVCGDAGTLLKSGDGSLWSPVASGQSVILGGATYGDNRFVVVGEAAANSGMVLASDRDPGILWQTATVSASEAAGSVTLTIKRLGPTASTASVQFQTAPGSAAEGVDFAPSSGTAEFAADANSVDVVIGLLNNPEAEAPESFTVTLAGPAPAGLLLYQPAAATVTIVDAQDSDFDGLPDEWEIQYFGNVAAHGPADDPDSDGNSNARELADGTNPADPASANYRLTLGVSSGLGTLTASPDLPAYPKGTTVTLTPTGLGDFTFAAWQGDAAGSSNPLVFEIGADTAVQAAFGVSLGDALDDPGLAWTTSGAGPPWTGQGAVTSDGADAAAVGGLALGQQSSVEALVHGPATISFRWKVSTGQFDSYRFFIDASPKASLAGEADWATKTFFIGAGSHTVRWTYAKNSTSTAGSNQAWLDQVQLQYRYQDWQQAYFSVAERADPAISGPDADPDRDGNPNLLEYLFGLYPKLADAGAPALPVFSLEQSGGQRFPALTWSQHHQRAAYVALGVESSSTLEPGSWQQLALPFEQLSLSGALETLRVIGTEPSSAGPQGFLRLKASLLP